MKIITISREFGSGGRELGKRLADIMGLDYYDREIITAIADTTGMTEKQVEYSLENHIWRSVPLTFRNSFSINAVLQAPQIELLKAQTRVVRDIAKAEKDCIIVGRNADILLAEYDPFRIFVYADMESRISRCIERVAEGEDTTRKHIEENIRRIDKNRSATHETIAGTRWGECKAYDLMISTSGWEIKKLAPAVADFADLWFRR